LIPYQIIKIILRKTCTKSSGIFLELRKFKDVLEEDEEEDVLEEDEEEDVLEEV